MSAPRPSLHERTFVEQLQRQRPTTCPACEYEESDGTLRWQCADCAWSDLFRAWLLTEAKLP